MNKYIYCYFNKVLGFYSTPFALDAEPDKEKDIFIRDLSVLSDTDLDTLKEDDLYFLGVFNDEMGEFDVSCRQFVLPVSRLVYQIKAGRKALEDENEVQK